MRVAGKGACDGQAGAAAWRPALLHAVPMSALVLGLFYYWFAVADRHAVFLYEHLGATPFDEPTGSRYWMSGLVAGGVALILHSTAGWLLGRLPPAWWRVWLLCVPPLAVGIPAITMSCNEPVLPSSLAAACTVAALAGLALALAPGSLAAERPSDLAWLGLDGLGLVPTLLLLRVVELPGRSLAVSAEVACSIALGGTLAGALWLSLVTALRARRRRPTPGAGVLFLAGLGWSYLLLPLVHHLVFTPRGYRYISAASNFFASNVGVQAAALLVAAGLALGITRLRRAVLPEAPGSRWRYAGG